MSIADFLAGWTACAFGSVIVFPLDTVRARKQIRGHSPFQILRSEPVKVLYSGVFTPVAFGGVMAAGLFTGYEFFKEMLEESPYWRQWTASHRVSASVGVDNVSRLVNSEVPMVTHVCAGSLSGMLVAVVQTPMMVIKTHQQLMAAVVTSDIQPGKGSGAAATVSGGTRVSAREVCSRLYKKEGLRGFYRGFGVEVASGAVGRALYFSVYEGSRRAISGFCTKISELTRGVPADSTYNYRNNPLVIISAAFMTSAASWFFIYPMDTIKNKIQGESLFRERRFVGWSGTRSCLRSTLKRQGLNGLFAGYTLAVVRTGANSSMLFPLYEYLRFMFRNLLV